MLGTFFRRGASFLLIPLYAAFLAPDAFAVLAFAEVIMSLARILFAFGLDAATFRFYFIVEPGKRRRRFYGTLWLSLLIMSGTLAGALTLLGPRIFEPLLRQIAFEPYIRLALWIAFLRAGFELMTMELFRAQGKANRYALYSGVSFVVMIASQVYFVAVLREGVLGALQGTLLTSMFMALLYARFLFREVEIAFSLSDLRRALAYGVPLLPHFLAHWILRLSDRWILENTVPMTDLGLYSLGDQVRQGYNVVPWSANSAIMPTFGRAAKSEQERSMIPALSSYYLMGVGAVGVAVVLFTPVVLPLIAPPAYQGAARVVPWLILGTFFYAAYFLPMNVLSHTVGDTKSVSLVTLTAGAANILLNVLLIPRFGIMAAAFNTAVGYGLLLALMQWRSQTRLQLGFEYVRAAKVLVAGIMLYGLSAVIPLGVDPGLDWLIRSALLSLYPLLLIVTGAIGPDELSAVRDRWAER